MNSFLEKLINTLNTYEDYDLQELADTAGIEFETAVVLSLVIVSKTYTYLSSGIIIQAII